MERSAFENGVVYINGQELGNIAEIEWQKHPKFDGVFVKVLFSGKNSDEKMNAMLVKIEPNRELGDHVHHGQAELHEVAYGEGDALVNGKSVKYKPGVVSWVPADIPHSIKAGDTGVLLLAKFMPPL
ncbi:MAG: cupin domain-containing protein [Leptospirales bacterium]|nr:cupin domain-containing protein [Leptospirales bacterium]